MRLRLCVYCATFLAAAPVAVAHVPPTPAALPLVTGAIDEGDTVALPGETTALIASSQDMGHIAGGLALPHISLFLRRAAARQAALDALVASQQKHGNPEFHRWVNPAELAPAFGPAPQDIVRVTDWLIAHGFAVQGLSGDGMTIDFAGTAGQVESAFRTELHNFTRHGEAHIANISEPSIPRALEAVVAGVGLHNFFPKPNMKPGAAVSLDGKSGGLRQISGRTYFVTGKTALGKLQLIGPNDFAVIYNVLPARNGSPLIGVPLTGLGSTVAVLDDSSIHPKDWNRFRKVFGLSGYQGTLTLQNPGNCGNPGFANAEGEATIDAEWASVAAPDADVIQASCPSNLLTFGVQTALQNLVSYGTSAQLISISYGSCEAAYGPTFLAAWTQVTEEAAAEGISILIAAGDGGSDTCDDHNTAMYSVSGIGVNGLAANPYVTAVGGTDFYDAALGQTDEYFAKKNRAGLETALSYVPEIAWNNSCASPVLLKFRRQQGKTTAQTPVAYCNDPDGQQFLDIGGGGGGPSSVYAKPDWQSLSVFGVPNDGVRDLPDASLFSGVALWGHGLLFCWSDPKFGEVPCDYHNTTDVLFQFAGGTSFAAPALAGIMAMATELLGIQEGSTVGMRIGNVAPRLYQLASGEFSNGMNLKLCDATRGNKVGTACIFNNVTANSNSVPCLQGTPNCYTNSASTMGLGVLSAHPDGSGVEAYLARPGWSFATGLGSVNATNLLSAYFYY